MKDYSKFSIIVLINILVIFMSFTTGCSLFQDNYKSFYLDSVPKSEDKVTMTPDLTVEHSFLILSLKMLGVLHWRRLMIF